MWLIKTETGSFIKKKRFNGLTVPCDGEGSQSWQKAKEEQSHVLHGGREESEGGSATHF